MIQKQSYFAMLRAKLKDSLQKALIGGALMVVIFAMILLTVAGALILVPTIFIVALCVACSGLSAEEFKQILYNWKIPKKWTGKDE